MWHGMDGWKSHPFAPFAPFAFLLVNVSLRVASLGHVHAMRPAVFPLILCWHSGASLFRFGKGAGCMFLPMASMMKLLPESLPQYCRYVSEFC